MGVYLMGMVLQQATHRISLTVRIGPTKERLELNNPIYNAIIKIVLKGGMYGNC